jgi:ABC-type dipeptide/oligopeptide/nickel transport system permease subunit
MAPAALPMFDAFLLQAGYNATLVTLGSMLLGVAAGVTGTFLYLRKRSLISDALAHATLPGVGLAFLLMVALGGDGRSLPLLLVGAGLSALAGLLCVHLLSTRTRLPLDAAVGAVLSVSYGLGIVILTVIQTLSAGRQAGLEGFLLGSAAGMLRSDALLIGFGGAAAALLVILSLFGWMGLSDYVRAEFLRNRQLDYVKSARALGVGNGALIWRHLLPNSMTPVVTFLPFRMSAAILALTSLDFLGLGVPPDTPSLGELLNQGKNSIDAWWISLSTFAVLVVTLLLLTFMGDALRDALDPRKAAASDAAPGVDAKDAA